MPVAIDGRVFFYNDHGQQTMDDCLFLKMMMEN